MAGIQDLIDVQLVDATNYVDVENSDILGTVFAHYWGPVSSDLRRFTVQQFVRAYPESVPFVPTSAKSVTKSIYTFMSSDAVVSYAQILKAFTSGISTVEVKNIANLNRFVIFGDSLTASAWKSEEDVIKLAWAITLKYRGYLPESLVGTGVNAVKFSIDPADTLYTLQVKADDLVLEEFTGSFVPNTIVNGQDVYFGTLLQNSNFLSLWVNDTTESITVTQKSEVTYSLPESITKADLVNVENSLEIFGDIKKSFATLLVSPYNFTTTASISTIDSKLASIASSKKTLIFVQGVHTEQTLTDYQTGKYPECPNENTYFSVFVMGREQVICFGRKVYLNCTAGWCGCTAKVASQVRLNQLASAESYGSYKGVLSWSPDFSSVISAHKKGIITVYSSDEGPQIFGVRAWLKNQNTYYAKANVLRVLAAVLRVQIPILMRAIHTDASSNPITRRVLASQMTSALSSFIGLSNLAADSRIDMSDALNNDVDTKGGQILICVGYLHFYKLVEEIKYKIVATDSSVNVELS